MPCRNAGSHNCSPCPDCDRVEHEEDPNEPRTCTLCGIDLRYATNRKGRALRLYQDRLDILEGMLTKGEN